MPNWKKLIVSGSDATLNSLNVNNSITGATLQLSSIDNAGTDTDKFLVLDSNGNVDFRTGTEVRSDIGADSSMTDDEVQDIVIGMISGNTESGITVTAGNSNAKLDFTVASQTDNNFTNTLKTKLDNIEALADVTDTTNVVNSLTAGTNVTIDTDGTISSTDTNTQLSTADVRSKFTAGTNVSIANGVISSTDTNTQLSTEQVEDIVGGMLTGNTESGITVTYQDTDGTIDFSVASQTDNNFTNTLKTKLDNIAESANNYSLPLGTSTVRGGFKLGYTESGKNYPVEQDGEKLYVNVPWTDTNTDTNTQLSDDEVQDIVAGMVTGNTESGITVTVGDSGNTLDFVVASQTDNNFTNTLKTKLDNIASNAEVNVVDSVAGKTGAITLVKGDVDLGNVDNTSDADKPISTATQTALNGKVGTTSAQALGTAANVLTLSGNTLTLARGDNSTDTIDLSAYLDEDSRSISSGVLDGPTGIVTFTRDDSTTFTLDLSDLLDDTNLVTSVAGRNGVVVLTKSDVGLGNVENTALSTYTGDGGALDNQYITNGAGYITSFTNTQRTDEEIRDVAAAQWVNGTNTTVVKDDANNTIKINSVNTNTTYSTATSSTLGLVKIGYTENGKNYPVELSSGKMYVNVPWTDTNTDTNTQLSDDEVQDIVVGMISGNTESGITVTAGASNAKLDFTVASQTDNNFTNALKSKLDGIASSANNYTHPTHPGDDISIDTGALTGATVISDLDFNVTTDTNGHVTDANASVATRTLTKANIGLGNVTNESKATMFATPTFTGTVTLNTNDVRLGQYLYHNGDTDTYMKYDSNTITFRTGGTDRLVMNGSGLEVYGSGGTVLDIQGSQGQLFSVTDDLTGTLFTVSDISGIPIFEVDASGESSFDGDVVIDGKLSITTRDTNTSSTTALVMNGNEVEQRTLGSNAFNSTTIPSAANNATITISAGDALTGGAAFTTNQSSNETITINHADTSTQASVNNSGRTYIQDITLDAYGHITGITSATETVVNTDTNTTYTADGNYGMTLSGTAFRLEDDRRRNSSTTDIYTGNTHDFTFYDASVGIRWYTAGSEDMRLYDNGTLHVDGDIIAYSTTISDARLKDDVVTIENAIDKIKKLRGVEYTWNAGTRKDKRDLGLIAQEVEKVLPEIVHEHDMPLMDGAEDNTTYKTVDYEKIVGVLIEGMKELSAKVEELENKLK